uniref:NADH-ubiquinone oxidoreductase chain 2 n=1 Tax=Lachesilla sp. Lasp7Q TaxID=2597021 RepID=A0A8K1ZFX5_9NEOP|nr:NADH dehydrogenase subunit 2 [Lachesilla sp. Lasp7Q]
MLNNLNILFLTLTFSSSILAISSSSWLGAWMGLELNMLSFVPLMIEQKNSSTNEFALKYFLVQALASSMFIMLCVVNTFLFFSFSIFNSQIFNFLVIPLMIKLGAAPFQTWFIMLMNSLNWWKALLLATWQKIAPLFILTYLNLSPVLLTMMLLISLFTGSLGGFSQTTFQKIFAFSSVTHLGWLFSSMMASTHLLFFYFSLYIFMNTILFLSMFLMNSFFFNQNLALNSNPSLMMGILSLSGLPPFWGFIPKWMVIQHMILSNQMFLAFILIASALVNLIFYVRLIINYSLLSSLSLKWLPWNYFSSSSNSTPLNLMLSMTITSLVLFNFMLF